MYHKFLRKNISRLIRHSCVQYAQKKKAFSLIYFTYEKSTIYRVKKMHLLWSCTKQGDCNKVDRLISELRSCKTRSISKENSFMSCLLN